MRDLAMLASMVVWRTVALAAERADRGKGGS